ncbi:unnamed protein product [Vitrella brassicaformis CCMP3155]|uniref:Uncharacterized protein n=1 Tax=Vitrella brassicaformis (strain CCMP3155) TaxID=1169540 RepID=A0A0G4GQG9_VITBC|nr:unnamed protein product [Vitrella brassicaformis CCMP3155]|eukprot:CEM32691.1 unnamed protein product [Vitrella brassicaformis CCMP3155]
MTLWYVQIAAYILYSDGLVTNCKRAWGYPGWQPADDWWMIGGVAASLLAGLETVQDAKWKSQFAPDWCQYYCHAFDSQLFESLMEQVDKAKEEGKTAVSQRAWQRRAVLCTRTVLEESFNGKELLNSRLEDIKEAVNTKHRIDPSKRQQAFSSPSPPPAANEAVIRALLAMKEADRNFKLTHAAAIIVAELLLDPNPQHRTDEAAGRAAKLLKQLVREWAKMIYPSASVA